MKNNLGLKKVKLKHIKHKQVATQDDSYGSAQHQGAASCLINAEPVSQVAFEHIKCVSPTIFPQKLYQSHAIAEEYEQAIDANSLEKINKLFDKVLELGLGCGKL